MHGAVNAEFISVIDGDTINVRARIWLNQAIQINVRLSGIDTPEIKGKCEEEKQLAKIAYKELLQLIENETIQLYDIRQGKYSGRILANIKTLDGVNINNHLIEKGYARTYNGGKREGWCSNNHPSSKVS